MHKFVKNLLIGVIALVGTKIYVATSQLSSETQKKAEMFDGIVAVANKSYPKMVDGGIRIEKMTHEKGVIYYNKTLTNNTVSEFNLEDIERSKGAMVKEICNSSVANLLNEGAVVGNRYRDKNGLVIFEYKVAFNDCES